MTTREKLYKVLLHLTDYGKIESGTPESKMLIEVASEFESFSERMKELEEENIYNSWKEASENGWLMDGR